MVTVYRVQGADGRGPFRPGFSKQWADEDFGHGVIACPTWGDEFGWDLIDRLGMRGEYYGSAVRAATDLAKWFSRTEAERLEKLGFFRVMLRADRILAESKHQLMIAKRSPLKKATAILPWSVVHPKETALAGQMGQ